MPCLCAPTTHEGSFRCRLHRNISPTPQQHHQIPNSNRSRTKSNTKSEDNHSQPCSKITSKTSYEAEKQIQYKNVTELRKRSVLEAGVSAGNLISRERPLKVSSIILLRQWKHHQSPSRNRSTCRTAIGPSPLSRTSFAAAAAPLPLIITDQESFCNHRPNSDHHRHHRPCSSASIAVAAKQSKSTIQKDASLIGNAQMC